MLQIRIQSAAIDGQVRKEVLQGREHIVVPVIALVEGVLDCATCTGPELALAAEFGKVVESWNGRPVTNNHPSDSEGNAVSAGSAQALNTFAIGVLLNTHLDGTKLHTEAWLDAKRLKDTAPSILQRISNNNEKIEVSTGYYATLQSIKGKFNNVEYIGVQTDIKPDHLAFLPEGAIGACSWADGCGVRVNEGINANIIAKARKPTFSGTETTSWSNVSTTFQDFRDAYYKLHSKPESSKIPSSVKDASAIMRSWIASKTLLGDPKASTTRDLIFFPVVDPSTDKLNEGALKAVISGRGSQAHISPIAKASSQQMARKLLESEFGMKSKSKAKANISRLFSAVASLLYDEGDETLNLEDLDMQLNIGSKGEQVTLKDLLINVRKEAVTALKANDNCKLTEEELNKLTIEQLQFLVDNNGKCPEGKDCHAASLATLKQVTPEQMVMNAHASFVTALKANDNCKLTEEELNKLTIEQLQELTVNNGKSKSKENSKETKETKEIKVQNPEEYIQQAPAEIREVLNEGLRMHREQKDALIKALKANENCIFTEDQLKAKDISELMALVKLAKIENYGGRAIPGVMLNTHNVDKIPEPPKVSDRIKAARNIKVVA